MTCAVLPVVAIPTAPMLAIAGCRSLSLLMMIPGFPRQRAGETLLELCGQGWHPFPREGNLIRHEGWLWQIAQGRL